jgi:hypothetical protein
MEAFAEIQPQASSSFVALPLCGGVCGKTFVPKTSRQKTCLDPACVRAYQNKKSTEYWHEYASKGIRKHPEKTRKINKLKVHDSRPEDVAPNYKIENCLRCTHPFMSEGKHNRVCPNCRKINGFDED